MPSIAWSDSYRVGQPALDVQHRKLLELHNRLDAICDAKDSCNDIMFVAVLQDLYWQLVTHFRAEERYMRAIGYPALEPHMRDHSQFLEAVANYCEQTRTDASCAVDVLARLSEWMIRHMQEADGGIRAYSVHVG